MSFWGIIYPEDIIFRRWQAFRQVNFQEVVTLHSSRRPSLVSLDNESQVADGDGDDDDAGDDDAGDEEDDFDDDRSSSIASSADRSDVCDDTWIDGSTTFVWHRMLHALNKVSKDK